MQFNEKLAAVFSILLGLPLILVILSLDAVEQNEYGLVYNWVSKTLRQDVYHGGTHFIGFWNKFIVFPATVQTIEFSDRPYSAHAPMLHTRTKEGLGLHLSISFQYMLEPSRLSELFALTNTNYEGLFRRIARDQLLEAASEYEGPQYWLERHKIGEHMRRLVDEQLRESCASLWGLQLQVIDLPDRYEESITMTQVQQQMVKTRRNEQLAASIRADTEVLRAEYARQIQVVQADAQANYTRETLMAKAEAGKRKIAAEAEALGYVRKKLGLSPGDAVRYEQLNSYTSLDNATFVADMPGLPQVGVAATAAAAMVPASIRQNLLSTRREPDAVPHQQSSQQQTQPPQQQTPHGLVQGNAKAADQRTAPGGNPALRPRSGKSVSLRQQIMSFFHEGPDSDVKPS